MKEPINTVRLIGQVPVTDVLVMRTVCRAVNGCTISNMQGQMWDLGNNGRRTWLDLEGGGARGQ